jgi:hypothetical protein
MGHGGDDPSDGHRDGRLPARPLSGRGGVFRKNRGVGAVDRCGTTRAASEYSESVLVFRVCEELVRRVEGSPAAARVVRRFGRLACRHVSPFEIE